MKRFDPGCFAPPAEGLRSVPVHGVAWRQKWKNWWAGATIASPTTDVAVPAKQMIEAIRRLMPDQDALNTLYLQETGYARYWARTVLGLGEQTPVILESSGTAAILLATRMFAHIGRHPDFRGQHGPVKKVFTITTTEEGSLVIHSLKGNDPFEVKNVMFMPATSVFFEPGPALPYPEGVSLAEKVISLQRYDNNEIVEQIRLAVEEQSRGGTTSGCILLPTVSKTGRILPVKEVAALVAEMRSAGHNLFFVVDDVQGMARRDADAMKDPLSDCDAYVYGTSKALGGILVSSAIVMKEELVRLFIEKTRTEGFPEVPVIAHFQFEPRYEAELPDWIMKRSAVSLPEITAANAAFMYFVQRGKGDTLQARRLSQLALVERQRARVVDALEQVPHLRILRPTVSRPAVPSIISFEIDCNGVTPYRLKKALQQGDPIVTLTAPVGSVLRIDIPEYRSLPPTDVLASRLTQVIEALASIG